MSNSHFWTHKSLYLPMIQFEPHSKNKRVKSQDECAEWYCCFLMLSRLMNTSWSISDSDCRETHCMKVRRDKSSKTAAHMRHKRVIHQLLYPLLSLSHRCSYTCTHMLHAFCFVNAIDVYKFMKCLGHSVCLVYLVQAGVLWICVSARFFVRWRQVYVM